MDDRGKGIKRVLRSSVKTADESGIKRKRQNTDETQRQKQLQDIKRKRQNTAETRQQNRLQGIKRKRQNTAEKCQQNQLQEINKASRKTDIKHRSACWTIKSKKEYNIQLPEDTSICLVTGCHLLPSGEIILSEFFNKKLKKFDTNFMIVSACDVEDVAVGMCYLVHNMVAVSLGKKLQFADVSGEIKLTSTADLDTYCKGMTYNDSKIYIVDTDSVYILSRNGEMERKLYTHRGRAYFQSIAVSPDKERLYISSWTVGLITIDSSGNHLHTFIDEAPQSPLGVCVDNESNVLVCLTPQDSVAQFSKDGRRKVGYVIKKEDAIPTPWSMYLDLNTNTLIVGCQRYNKIVIVELA